MWVLQCTRHYRTGSLDLVLSWSASSGTQNHRGGERGGTLVQAWNRASPLQWWVLTPNLWFEEVVGSSESCRGVRHPRLTDAWLQIVRYAIPGKVIWQLLHVFYWRSYLASFLWYLQSIWGSLAPQSGSWTCSSVLCTCHENVKERVNWRGV